MGPGEVFALAIIMGSATALTFAVFNFILKVQKLRIEGKQDHVQINTLIQEVNSLKEKNRGLQKRIENLEAIVVDQDLDDLRHEFPIEKVSPEEKSSRISAKGSQEFEL